MSIMAAVSHRTERHLLRLFTRHAGVSPLQFLRVIRLERARHLIERAQAVSSRTARTTCAMIFERALPRGATSRLAFSASFVFSKGRFYWLGGRHPQPHWAQFVERFIQYYPMFLRTTAMYLAAAALAHLAVLVARQLPRSWHLGGR